MRSSAMLTLRGWNQAAVLFSTMMGIAIWQGESKAEDLTPPQIMSYMQAKFERGFTADQIAGFRIIVGRLDSDGDGHLSLDEYAKNTHFRNNPRGTRGFFGAADMNRDGLMSANEYAWQRIITDEARKFYFAMDADNNRRVTRGEFLKNSIVRDRVIAEKIFQGLDTNGNGELILPEYLPVWGRWARTGRHLGTLD